MVSKYRIVSFIKACLWREKTPTWTLLTVLISVFGWIGVGETWTENIKLLWLAVILQLTCIIYIMSGAYGIFKKVYLPLSVRKVVQGEFYHRGTLLVILDKSDILDVGDILTLFIRKDIVDEPICLLEVDTFTSGERYVQSVVIPDLSENVPVEYLIDESRRDQLYAKYGVSKKHLHDTKDPE